VALAVVEQIASALDEAHSHRLVHRDVKPQNVIIDGRNSHAYLSDFGLVRSLDATSGLTATGQQMGTLDYMSPEQLDGRAVDLRTDIYSLGCLLYAIVSGDRPFTGESFGAVVRQKLLGPSNPTLEDLGYSAALSQVVHRAQADDPSDRYSSAGELAAGMKDSLGPETAAAAGTVFSPIRTQPMRRRRSDPRQRRTTPVPSPPPQSPQRRRAAVGIFVALLVAGIGIAVFFATSSDSGNSGGSATAADSSTPSAKTTTTTSTVTDTTPDSSGKASEPVTGPAFEPFTGNLYTASVPKGWIPESIEEKNSGRYTSQWRDPSDSNTSILIDSQSSVETPDAVDSADSVRQQTSQTPGYKEISFGPTTLDGVDAAEWIFQLPDDQRVDYFKVECGAGFAILGSTSPERFEEMEPTFHHVAESVIPTLCE
jgi:serine/threonine-protein kinase